MPTDDDLMAALAQLDNIAVEDLASALADTAADPDLVEPEVPDADDTSLEDAEPEGEAAGPQSNAEPSIPQEGGDGDGPPADESSPPSPAIDVRDLFVDLYRDTYGVEPTPEAVVEALGVAADLRHLTAEQRATVQAWLRGEQPLATQPPVHQNQGQFPVPTAPAPQLAPSPTVPPGTAQPITLPTIPEGTYIDDEVRAVLEAQNAAIAAQQQAVYEAQQQAQYVAQQQAAVTTQAERERMVQVMVDAERTWREQNPEVGDSDYIRLTHKANQSPIMPQLLQQNGNDVTAATHQLLNITLAGLPDIATRVQNTRIQAAADRAAADQTRKQKAGALAGGATSAPKSTPATKKERDAAAIAEMAQFDAG